MFRITETVESNSSVLSANRISVHFAQHVSSYQSAVNVKIKIF